MAYPARYLPEHPRADLMGYVHEHILIMEKVLGRPLRDGELVHHKDWNKHNNPEDGSNYHLTTRAGHQRIPQYQARYLAQKGLLDDFFTWWKENEDILKMQDQLEEMESQQHQERRRLERRGRRLKCGSIENSTVKSTD